ncbi:MAG: FAD-dependent oxidoreductase [Bradyrhizobium sp. PARBB1]|nr:MAG: FAD-dependent oxidoreductase [Bradyrhizobium sp. PARBB1]
MARVDLTVRGGGIFGLACAFSALRRGAKVRLIETRQIGAGSSGGLIGALAPHVPENWNPKKQFQLDSLLMAGDFWTDVASIGGTDAGYLRSGRLQPLPDANAVDLARARILEASILWQGRATWSVIPATGAAWEPHSPTGLLIHDTLTARLSPRAAGQALTVAIRALGGEAVIGDHADEGAVLWATGYQGLQDLNAAFGKTIGAGVKGQSLSLRLPDLDPATLPQLFADALHIVPHADGSIAIGSTSENTWDAPDSIDAACDALLDRARAALPILTKARIIDRWAGIRPRARTRAPMLGPWPGRPGHFIANGGFKIGFGMAPKVAQVMADLILTGDDSAIPAGFRVEANL